VLRQIERLTTRPLLADPTAVARDFSRVQLLTGFLQTTR
jgi:hypothetical protein